MDETLLTERGGHSFPELSGDDSARRRGQTGMMQDFKRTDRVGDQIKMEIADIFMKKIKDPRVGFVTITAVQISDDLRHAKVFVTIQKDQDERQTFMGLKKATSFVRGELARRLRLRYIPELIFLPDASTERVGRVLDLLEQLKKEEP